MKTFDARRDLKARHRPSYPLEKILSVALVPVRCDGRVYLKGLRSKPPFVKCRQIYSCRVKPPYLAIFGYAPDKKTFKFFHVKIVTQASE